MDPRPADVRISVVVVTWNEQETIGRCLPPLVAQLRPGDELIVSDNASSDGTLDVVAELAPDAVVVQNGGNVGFPAACNSGARCATGDLLVLLNPDTEVADGWREAIARPASDGRGWAAWQALMTMDGGRRVNTSGGVVHFTGIAWAGQMGEPIEDAPVEPHEIAFPSGACLALRLEDWRRIGGMPEHFFLYYDDVDLAFMLRLEGGRIGIEPAARVDHAYEFSRRSVKWRVLERNRWASIIRTYPGALLAVLLPALVLTEIGVLAIAVAGGWGGQKALAMGDVAKNLPLYLRERRSIQGRRTVPAAEFADWLVSELSSPYLGPGARIPVLRWGLELYWRAARALLRAFAQGARG